MLSICIPIYNKNCNKLVDDLCNQMSMQNEAIEIICIDDYSANEYKILNEPLVLKSNYIKLEQNIGRARIRNKFIDYAKHEWLFFLDCDAIISNVNYIETYINIIKKNTAKVICGGTYFTAPTPMNKANNLCYLYNNENNNSKTIEQKNIKPYASFMTNNILIHQSVFNEVRFDETLVKYGHEDTLFGFQLMQKNISILHINNNVTCIANDDNKIFLMKTDEALDNLVLILKKLDYDKAFIGQVKILSFYYSKSLSKQLAVLLTGMLQSLLYKMLCNGYYNKQLFSLYKVRLLNKKLGK